MNALVNLFSDDIEVDVFHVEFVVTQSLQSFLDAVLLDFSFRAVSLDDELFSSFCFLHLKMIAIRICSSGFGAFTLLHKIYYIYN